MTAVTRTAQPENRALETDIAATQEILAPVLRCLQAEVWNRTTTHTGYLFSLTESW